MIGADAGSQIKAKSEDKNVPRYAAGEIIIKVKEDDSEAALADRSYSMMEAAHDNRLGSLMSKHSGFNLKVKGPLFNRLHTRFKAQKNLSLK